jgi:hypothetical protein
MKPVLLIRFSKIKNFETLHNFKGVFFTRFAGKKGGEVVHFSALLKNEPLSPFS